MKKQVVITAIITLSILSSMNHLYAQKGFQLGIQGIPQYSWLMNKDDKDNGNFEYLNTVNAAFGISGQYGFTENTGIGINVLYSMQGQRYRLSTVERYRHVDYLKIPIMFVNNTPISENVMFFYKIGPQLAITTAAKLTDKDGNAIVSDQKSAYQNMEFGAVAAAGLGINLAAKLYLDVAIRYDYGFTDAENKDYQHNFISTTGNGGTAPSNRALTHNMTLGLAVGLRYSLCCSQ